jgi:hypothetical protein
MEVMPNRRRLAFMVGSGSWLQGKGTTRKKARPDGGVISGKPAEVQPAAPSRVRTDDQEERFSERSMR